MLDEQTPAEAGNEPASTTAAPESAAPDTPEAAPPARKRASRKTTAKKAAPAPSSGETAASVDQPSEQTGAAQPAAPAPRKRAPRKTTAKKTAAPEQASAEAASEAAAEPAAEEPQAAQPAKKAAARKTTAKKTTAKKSAAKKPAEAQPEAPGTADDTAAAEATAAPAVLFQPPDESAAKPAKKKSTKKTSAKKAASAKAEQSDADAQPSAEPETETEEETQADAQPEVETAAEGAASDEESSDETEGEEGAGEQGEGSEAGARRRRRRGGRRRRKPSGGSGETAEGGESAAEADSDEAEEPETAEQAEESADTTQGEGDSEGGSSSSSRRRRRRRRGGEADDNGSDDSGNTVTKVRKPRSAEDEITSFSGSTRLEAKKQRRREGREAGRRRAPIISEAEFLARREAVDRKMVIRQRGDLTQIAVLEDKVLVEHYVARESQTSLIGNVYLGRVQNVLPSMEAAFIDIGKGRNAVLYAGEVNWDALGAKDGNQRKIEQVLKPGQAVLVQVSKDPIGHKGARLTSQISLPGRFLVYVPDGNTSGISRKLPENERNRLKSLLKEIVPDTAGVIVRTAAEGASESELTRDVERLKALWEDISSKVEGGNAPQLLYGEPDLTLKVVRDLFTEDIGKLVVSGEEAWEMVEGYVNHVAPDLVDRLERHDDSERDAFAEYRIDEQINKALDRKVWLPSGGSLVIDRTEAMTVVDVNTGKFTGSGGNLEETVTKNNLEAAEEIVRQLRLRDIGGIVVIDFIDMVLESNRDLVLRRLIECLGRDRTRHQVAEVTSLGLVQMTRKRIGTGLLEAFSEPCEHCQGRGLHLHQEPVEQKRRQTEEEPRRSRRSRGRGKSEDESSESTPAAKGTPEVRRPTPAEFAAMARAESANEEKVSEERAVPEESSATDETPAKARAEEQPASTPVSEEESRPEPEAEAQAETEREPEPSGPPPPPAAPRILTSVRRVGARRPAGPPAGQTAVVPAEEPSRNGTSPEGGAAVAPDAAAADGTGEEASEAGAVDGAVDTSTQPHVPVKKKGARKR